MSDYNPKEEALKIADIVPMSDIAIEYIANRLECAYINGMMNYNKEFEKWRVESDSNN